MQKLREWTNQVRKKWGRRIERMQKIDNTWEYTKEWTWLSNKNIANEEREIISHIKIISKRMFYMDSDCLQIINLVEREESDHTAMNIEYAITYPSPTNWQEGNAGEGK